MELTVPIGLGILILGWIAGYIMGLKDSIKFHQTDNNRK